MMKRKSIIKLSELGRMYSPDSSPHAARLMMHGIIGRTPGLKSRLNEMGFDGRTVTPKMLDVFYDLVGKPKTEEYECNGNVETL